MHLSLRRDINNLIKHINTLLEMPYKENVIEKFNHISFTQNKTPVNVIVAARRICAHEENRIFVAVIKEHRYPVDFFDVLKYNDGYTFIMKNASVEKYYRVHSLLGFDKQTEILDDLVNDFSGLVLDN